MSCIHIYIKRNYYLLILAREIMKNELVEINEKMADLDDFLETHGKRQQRKGIQI